MKIDIEKLHSMIIRRRNALGYTQTNMGQTLGISQKNYMYLESGKCKMGFEKLMKIADALKINPMDIIEVVASEANWPSCAAVENSEKEKIELMKRLENLKRQNNALLNMIERTLEKKI